MEITAITQQKRSEDRVNLFLDGKFWIAVSKDDLLKEQIVKGLMLDEARKVELEELAEEGKLYFKVVRYVQMRPRSIEEVRRQLVYKYGADEQVAAKVINKLKSLNLLDDFEFAKWFVENRLHSKKAKGKRMIRAELQSKGVNKAAISSALQLLTENPDLQTAKIQKFIEKERPKLERKGLKGFALKQKLTEKLMRKGFTYDSIQSSLKEKS